MCSKICDEVRCVFSSLAIILLRKRDLVTVSFINLQRHILEILNKSEIRLQVFNRPNLDSRGILR